MTSKIKIPYDYLQRIRETGKRVSKSRLEREVHGMLLGTYMPQDDSILISEMYDIITNRGDTDDHFFGKLYDELKRVISIPRIIHITCKAGTKRQKLKAEEKELGIVNYHTHPSDSGSWSESDLRTPSFSFPTAFLLYMDCTETFCAINEQKESIEIEVMGGSNKILGIEGILE